MGISAITLWELAWLATNNRLELSGTVEAFVERISSRTSIRPLTVKVAVLANQLPPDYSQRSLRPDYRRDSASRGHCSRHKRQKNPSLQADQDYLVSVVQKPKRGNLITLTAVRGLGGLA